MPRGSAFMVRLRCCADSGGCHFLAVDCKIGAIHPTQVTATALFWRYNVRRMVALGIEGRGEGEHFGRAEFHAKATSLAALYDDGNASFCHGTRVGSDGHSRSLGNYGVPMSQTGVMGVTDVGDLRRSSFSRDKEKRRSEAFRIAKRGEKRVRTSTSPLPGSGAAMH